MIGNQSRSGWAARCRRLPVLVLTIASFLFTNLAFGQEAAGEYQVKAAFLPNFARYVEWPEASLPAAGAPLVIAIVGDDPFGGSLELFLRGVVANGHPIILRHYRWSDSLAGCHLVFISTSEASHVPAVLRGLSGASVLTVSDIDRFSLSGGMIELRMVGNRVRFDVNRAAADEAHLKISSKLLAVARAVITSEPRGRTP
jgi:hypothetical protein